MISSPQILGASSIARSLEEEINCAARSDAKVLITGESGVGKEVVARLIHQRSARRLAALVTINCAGIPDTLLASELFGHVRGSFTDAYRDKKGWIEQAHHGTIFMDEIGEMSAQMQSLLLRFLENGEIQRVGSDRKAARFDVRVIAATNRRLLERVAAGDFREDLFYRLNVIHIEIPPLRKRREDIPVMLEHFLKQFAESHRLEVPRLSEEAAAQVAAADWPGNVRQLRNVAERLVVRARSGVITPWDLPREILSITAGPQQAGGASPCAQLLFKKMVQDGESFWDVVYEPFMARDITRDDLRAVVRESLALSRGSYKGLVQLLNMPPGDYKRLLNFLRKFDCHLPIHEFRAASARLPEIAPALSRPTAINE
ncbi:MAG TPA: sigma-54 dependent transcriptional regulator [Vicinamibacterales bacterium]|nr:sigma-54 dependent transcriptional regulator [Vicinamibacterales bacterium]